MTIAIEQANSDSFWQHHVLEMEIFKNRLYFPNWAAIIIGQELYEEQGMLMTSTGTIISRAIPTFIGWVKVARQIRILSLCQLEAEL
jgi:hypothetical protein